MRTIDEQEARDLAAEAARAPSVYNIQPARWRFLPGEVLLFRDPRRTLPVADPSGHDVLLSLGAAFEGMSLALSKRGMGLVGLKPAAPQYAGPGLELIVRSAIVEAEPDPLAEWVPHRRAFRGVFAPGPVVLDEREDVRIVTDRPAIHRLARRYDRASYGFLRQPVYLREFFEWCRFSPEHPNWDRDGLNADCLALSRFKRVAASWLLRPRVFAVLERLRLASLLVSEAAQIRSAGAILLVLASRAHTPFDVGRRFYRLWLEITARGLALTPMSALSADPVEAARLAVEHRVPESHRLINLFRVGKVGSKGIAKSPRLPVEELLV